MAKQTNKQVKTSLNAGEVAPRNIDFELLDGVTYDWHSGDPGISNFWNALSLLFPEGEEFFVQSARGLAKHVDKDNEALRRDLRAFMTQEMLHTREHIALNDMLKRHGIKSDALNNLLKRFAVFGHKRLPKKVQLAITVSAEHWTATLAELVLQDDQSMEGAHPKMKALWSWHAVEETEHKAVCFDLLQDVCRDEQEFYRLRATAHALSVVPGLLLVFGYYLALMQHTGNLVNFRSHGRLARFLLIRPGHFRRVVPLWLEFFRSDFHPWDRDNRDKIESWDAAAPNRDQYPPQFAEAAE